MAQKLRVLIAAVLVTLALLGTGWVASTVSPAFTAGVAGENGG